MKLSYIIRVLCLPTAVCWLAGRPKAQTTEGKTEVTKWQYDKAAAVSLTYDDGYITQFTQALPIMNRLKMPATFFIITGNIPGSQYKGKFIGRSVASIIQETSVTPTNKDNFFERASAAPHLDLKGTLDFHVKAGSLIESGKTLEAYKVIDELYQKVRSGEFQPVETGSQPSKTRKLTWDEVKKFAAEGHEFASHTVTHPMTPVLDEPNLLYELEKSKEDILRELGSRYVFSAECPFGIEDERVMEYAHKVYPALRNRMPAPYLEELNRSAKKLPGTSAKEYVQWQRGATTKTPLHLMKSWIDTVLTHQNNWLVLVFHGVDGLGYEALSHELLDEYFQYIKEKEDKLWVATFADATKYMRERQSAIVKTNLKDGKILLTVSHPLDKKDYDVPLTLKTYVSADWKNVSVKQGTKTQMVIAKKDSKGAYVLYQVKPDATSVELSVI